MKINKKTTTTGTEGKNLDTLLKGFDDRFEKMVCEIRGLVKNGDKILDIGCGEGKIWELFPNMDVYGIDMSQGNLKKARKFLKPTLGSAEKLPFKDKTFDLVVASEILEHLISPDKTFKEINRVLKPRGNAIITFPNTSSLQFRFGIFLFGSNPALNYPENLNHIRFFNIKDIIKMIGGTSLKIKKVRGVGFLAFHPENFGIYIPVPRKIRTFGGDCFPSLSSGNLVVFSKAVE